MSPSHQRSLGSARDSNAPRLPLQLVSPPDYRTGVLVDSGLWKEARILLTAALAGGDLVWGRSEPSFASWPLVRGSGSQWRLWRETFRRFDSCQAHLPFRLSGSAGLAGLEEFRPDPPGQHRLSRVQASLGGVCWCVFLRLALRLRW